MEMWQEMLCAIAEQESMEIKFPQLKRIDKLMEEKCYTLLTEIKNVLENSDLDDKECFLKIEEIVCCFERQGIKIKSRHDF